MGRYYFGQKSKSDISVCSVSWSRTISAYLGQLHRYFSLQIGCRYGWTTLEFRWIRFPAEIEIRYFGVLSVLELNDIWISRATPTEILSTEWLPLWMNDIRISVNPFPGRNWNQIFRCAQCLWAERHLDISGNFTEFFFPEIGCRFGGTRFYFSVNPFFGKYRKMI